MPVKPKEVAPPPKVMGKLLLSTDPSGASVTKDGKPFPHFTPTEVEAEVGSTVRIGLKLDGYVPKEEEVIVASGERPMEFKLEKAVPVAPAAPVVAVAPKKDHDHHHGDHDAIAKLPKEAVGKGTISVFVRPWAIVYVDGNAAAPDSRAVVRADRGQTCDRAGQRSQGQAGEDVDHAESGAVAGDSQGLGQIAAPSVAVSLLSPL